jgi:hypothetical protein
VTDHNNRPDHSALLGLPERELRLLAGDATHQHFKGGLYRLLGPVQDSLTGEPLAYRWTGQELAPEARQVLVYEHCYPHERQLWARPRAEFEQEVDWPDGVRRPRFRRLGEEAK